MSLRHLIRAVFFAAYVLFISVSFVVSFHPGKEIGLNFLSFLGYMLKILPCAFLLIGLFEVWVERETVEKRLGEEARFQGHVWAVLLAATTVGGIYVAFPMAYSLLRKGAKLSVIFTYMGASAICRVPMTIFEASFLGARFSIIRLCVSLPLVVLTSMVLGDYLSHQTNQLPGPPRKG